MTRATMLTRVQITDLAERYKEGDQAAGAKILAAYMPMIIKDATRAVAMHQVDKTDMIQELSMAFWKALSKFDPSLNTALSSFARFYMKDAVLSYASRMSGELKIPKAGATRKLMSHAGWIVHEYEKEFQIPFGGPDGEVYMAEKTGASIDEVRRFLTITCPNNRSTHSTGETNGEGDEASHGEADFAQEDYSLEVSRRMDVQNMIDIVSDIVWRYYDERDYDIIMSRMTVDDQLENLAELSERHGLGKERVRQIQRESFDIIRERLAVMGISSVNEFCTQDA